MKIKYEFADGTVSEVEVDEEIGGVIAESRKLEDNLARKERYHCYSMDAAEFEDGSYGTEDTLLWSSFFVTLMAKKISVFQIAVYYAAILA